jgi:hypothetical protein
MIHMSSLHADSCSVWDRQIATVAELCSDPEWPIGRSATYKAIKRGEVPARHIGGTLVVIIPALREQLGLDHLAA